MHTLSGQQQDRNAAQAKMAEPEMSNDEVKQLLKQAEERLRARGAFRSRAMKTSLPKITSKPIEPYLQTTKTGGARINPAHLIKPDERELANAVRVVEDPIAARKKNAEAKKATAGADWYNLPRTVLTPELKKDLQLLRMRDVLDPKRHYKKDNKRDAVPEYSQVGTIIQGPTEYFSSRLSNKDRKRTMVEETIQTEKQSGRFKAKYDEIQAAKTSGRKAHYKKMSIRRKGGVSKG